MIKSITNFLIILFIFQQLKSQISKIDQHRYNPFCDETTMIQRQYSIAWRDILWQIMFALKIRILKSKCAPYHAPLPTPTPPQKKYLWGFGGGGGNSIPYELDALSYIVINILFTLSYNLHVLCTRCKHILHPPPPPKKRKIRTWFLFISILCVNEWYYKIT